MTEEAKQQKLYLVTTDLPGPAEECVFIDVQDEDGKDLGSGSSGAEWEEHPTGHDLYRLGPFAKYGEYTPETQEESDARFDEWWKRRQTAINDEEMVAWYNDWLMETTGTESEVFTLLALIKRSRIDIANKRDEWEDLQDQLPAMEAALGLLHPITGEPLIEVIGGERGTGFTGHAVFLTASGRSAEGWWFKDEGMWKLFAKPAPEGWSRDGDEPTERET